ncbi:glutamate receptor ionotropic, kainate glr-3-like isoform X4 [Daphnia pulicaria]|uniref:glutamate receptor ionotropic, kainate glr-3-like isoform X4 n=1 Tax=Daphnia pulicaria TaxID=35523 RepID=UPI001EEB65B8|nr:glutamate receptor ionotropic, kainate glr-3-like isoform X4 [Daphnia pulicaria]
MQLIDNFNVRIPHRAGGTKGVNISISVAMAQSNHTAFIQFKSDMIFCFTVVEGVGLKTYKNYLNACFLTTLLSSGTVDAIGKLQVKMQVAATYRTKHLISTAILATLFLIAGEFSDADPDGRHFNYLAFHNPPYDTLIRGPNGTFTTFGASLELVKWLSAKFKFTFNVSMVNQTLIEKYGTHEASFYQLINDKNVDGIVCSFYLTMDRVKRMDFTSQQTWSEGFCLIVPRPVEESRLFAFIGPFQPTVWMLIFISLFVLVDMMTLFTWFYNRQRWNNLGSATVETELNNEPNSNRHKRSGSIHKSVFNNFSSHMIYVINIMTNQGCQEAFSRTSFRLLTGVWVLCAMVLVNSYTGIVTSSLTTPKMKPSIGSLEELAASKDIGVLIRHDTSIGEQILKATSGVYKVLGDQARLHPDQILGDPFTLASKLETGRYAYPFRLSGTNTKRMENAVLKGRNLCRFQQDIIHGFIKRTVHTLKCIAEHSWTCGKVASCAFG